MNESNKFSFGYFTKHPAFEQALYQFPKGPFLELGCGKLPFLPEYLAMLGPVQCIDHSEEAIEFCKSHFPDGEFLCRDILELDIINTYGIILDAHLLHCLDSVESYLKALKNIARSLKPGGLLLLETMTTHSQMAFEIGLNYETDSYKLYKGERVSRLVLPSTVIEALFIEAGLKIELLKVVEGLRMIPHDKREGPIPEDPQVLRLIASRIEAA